MNDYLASGTPTTGMWIAPNSFTTTIGSSTITAVNLSTAVATTGTYYISYSYLPYASSCTVANQFTVNIIPSLSLSIGANSFNCTNLGVGATISATTNPTAGASYTWQPGSLTGQTHTVSPTINTIYTVTASMLGCSSLTNTLSVTVSTNCCSNTLTPFSLTSVAVSTSVTGPLAIINSFTILPNTTFDFSAGEFLMGANVKITVSNNAALKIYDSHLYACSQDMWQGIEVFDGGSVEITQENTNNLIEDAIIAIDVQPVNPTINTLTNILIAQGSTFNKNYIDINISNYTRTITTYPFIIENCVFTCRDLPFTSSSWPQTGTISAASTASADLRYVNTSLTPTTGLASPYLNQSTFSITTLKNPYSNQPSHIAIQINSVGVTNGPQGTTNGTISMPGISIGNAGAANFNLFDSHGSFIVANKSNVTLVNNVFQNTRTYTVTGNTLFGGTAVKHSAVYTATDVMHTMLNMPASSVNTGNRFWNCHRGIELDNTYLFWLENALFRSTQSTGTLTGFLPGNSGILAATDNFDYYIANSEFTNLKSAINIPITSGLIAPIGYFSLTQPATGIFAHRIRIDNNIFAAGSGTNTYMNRAIDMTCPNSLAWQNSAAFVIPSSSVTPFTQAFSITNNTFDEVFNGISVNGSHGFQVDVSGNDISLKDNNTIQRGIALTNCLPTSAASIGKNIVSSNNVSFTSLPTFTQTALIFCGDNGYALGSPSVSCNDLTQSYQGFVFDGVNDHSLWGDNSMNVPIDRAFVLSHTAAIGAQGGTTTAIANKWVGGPASWSGTNYGTYVEAGTNVLLSKLYVRPTPSLFPQNNESFNIVEKYTLTNGIQTMTLAGGGDYTCGEFPNYKIHIPQEETYESNFTYYRAKSALYHFLHFNDSLRNNEAAMLDFYNAQEGTSIDKFMQMEELLYQGLASDASDLLADIDDTEFNSIETNYKTFYTLYLAFLDLSEGENLNLENSTALRTLAELCPGENGPVIYQAIALYNTLYGEIIVPDCSEGGGARMANFNSNDNKNKIENDVWNVVLFPNPAKNQLTITSNKADEVISIKISDLSGREVFSGSAKLKDFMTKLDLDLINGAYFISIYNSNNDKITKKLLIAK